MKNKEIIYKNNIQKKYLNSTLNRRLNKKYSNILKNIISNLDNTKDAFHSLSKKFKLNYTIKNFECLRK